MIRFREATQEDLDIMKGGLDCVTRVDFAYTLENEGEILLVGGFSMITPQTYWCWIRFAEDKTKLLTMYEVIVQWLEEFVDKMGIKRLQAFVKDIPEHLRLVKHLKFEKESTMKNFYGNEDAFLFRRLF